MSLTPVTDELGPFWADDVPTAAVVVEFVDENDTVGDLPAGPYVATLTGPAGTELDPFTMPATVVDDHLELAWTAFEGFDVAGLWKIVLKAGGLRVGRLRFIVQADSGWLTLEDAREGDWADAPADDVVLWMLLESARLSVLEWTPKIERAAILEGGAPATRLLLAQIMQAKAIRTSTKAGPDDSLGAEGFTVRVFPLDWNIKQIIRPKNPRPVIR